MRCLILSVIFLILPAYGYAEKVSGTSIGFFKSIEGDVHLLRAESRPTARPGLQIHAGDTIVTGTKSNTAVVFQDGTRMTLGEESELEIKRYEFQPLTKKYDFSIFLKKGSALYSSGKLGKLAPEKVNLKTPRAIVGIRGTRLLIDVN